MSTEQPDRDVETGTDPAVDETNDAENQESYHGYSVDDETQPQGSGDSLVDDRGLEEPLDEGYSPPEKWSAGQRYGNTPLEESMGESIDQRLEQEVPEPDPYEVAEREAEQPGDVEAPNAESGDERAGRLVEPDEGAHTDTEPGLLAEDVGIDGAGASAEEAAVHVADEEELGTPAETDPEDL